MRSGIQWHFTPKGTDISLPINFSLLSNDHMTLVISRPNLSNRGLYTVSVTNEVSSTEASVTLDVFVPVVLLNTNARSEMKEKGQSVSFNCTATGLPQPIIVWRKDGQVILNSTKRIIHQSLRESQLLLETTSILTINELRSSDNGNYSCRADNEANIGAILSTQFTLQVVEPPPPNHCESSPCQNNGRCRSLIASYLCYCPESFTGKNCQERVVVKVRPEITEPPQSTTGQLFSTVTFSCKATGSPIPTILWYKDGALITNNNADPTVLIFTELTLNDRGFYHCEARNTINGKNESVNSSIVLLNISDIVQYEAEIHLPEDFYQFESNQSSTMKSEERKVFDLIQESNDHISGSKLSNVSNTSFLFVQILNSNHINYTANPRRIPVVITLNTDNKIYQNQQLMIKNDIVNQLTSLSDQLNVNITLIDIERFDGCISTSTVIPSSSGNGNLSLTIVWPETNIGVQAVVDCPCGNGTSQLKATRYCGGNFINGASWAAPNIANCNFSDLARKICRLNNLPVTEKVEQLETLTRDTDALGSIEVAASVSVLVTATDSVSGNLSLTKTFLEVVDNILLVDRETLLDSQSISNTSGKMLEAIESIVGDVTITNMSEPVVIAQNSFAVSVQQVDFEEFDQFGQAFSVNLENSSNLSPEDVSFETTVSLATGAIKLPSSLFSAIPNFTNTTRITHSAFISDSLFQRRYSSPLQVSSIVISAAIVGIDTIRGLMSPIDLEFQINPNINGSFPQCVFWNQTLDNGYGDWSDEGCTTTTAVNDDSSRVMCQCDHLTSFAILLDVSPIIEPTDRTGLTLFLDSISYTGIIVSLVCLIITVISYLSNKKLRSSDHGQLLLNLCFALMGLYSSFIIALHSKYVDGLCVFVSALLQYFFLVTFAVMAAEAVNLYMNLVIVLGQKIHSYTLKATLTSWIGSFFIVIFCVAPNYKNYMSDHFCRVFNVPFYIGMVIPFLIIYIFNWVIFVVIIASLTCKASKLKKARPQDKHKSLSFWRQQLTIAITLSVLFGLGWGIGLFATEDIYSNKTVRDVFASLFVAVTAFHGLFIFIMHCLRSRDVRNVWKNWLTCRISKSCDKHRSQHSKGTDTTGHHSSAPVYDEPNTAGSVKESVKETAQYDVISDDTTAKKEQEANYEIPLKTVTVDIQVKDNAAYSTTMYL